MAGFEFVTSGDGPEYSLDREAEDVAAVVDATGGPAHLFGHSFGGACALEASLLTRNVGKLVLYEPPVAFSYAEGSIERQERLAAAGRADKLLEEVFLAEGVALARGPCGAEGLSHVARARRAGLDDAAGVVRGLEVLDLPGAVREHDGTHASAAGYGER